MYWKNTGQVVEMLLLIDNYDSFTYNLVQYLGELGCELHVHRNDQITLDEVRHLEPDRIVISPGPGTPQHAGISVNLVRAVADRLPVLGVCLGHQSIGQVFGGKIVKARQVKHGKTSAIHHDSKGVFAGLESPFTATRYHSLVIDSKTIPDVLEVTAWTVDENGKVDEVMGVRHLDMPATPERVWKIIRRQRKAST